MCFYVVFCHFTLVDLAMADFLDGQLSAELQKKCRQLDNLENSLLTTKSELAKLTEAHAETVKVCTLTRSDVLLLGVQQICEH